MEKIDTDCYVEQCKNARFNVYVLNSVAKEQKNTQQLLLLTFFSIPIDCFVMYVCMYCVYVRICSVINDGNLQATAKGH